MTTSVKAEKVGLLFVVLDYFRLLKDDCRCRDQTVMAFRSRLSIRRPKNQVEERNAWPIVDVGLNNYGRRNASRRLQHGRLRINPSSSRADTTCFFIFLGVFSRESGWHIISPFWHHAQITLSTSRVVLYGYFWYTDSTYLPPQSTTFDCLFYSCFSGCALVESLLVQFKFVCSFRQTCRQQLKIFLANTSDVRNNQQ